MKIFISIATFFFFIITASAQITVKTAVVSGSLAEQMTGTAMTIWKDSFSLDNKPAKWTYDQGVVLKGIEGVWNKTGNGDYFRYIQNSMDFFVDKDGNIKTYKPEEFNIDNVNNGRMLLLLYKVTNNEKYWKAASLLRDQLKNHPRTSEGGFWHKKIYPSQMWLDGLYMAEPFYAEYAATVHDDTAFTDIARQFILMEKHARDNKTGLLVHGWDESKQQKWADPVTGRSPNFWGRAMGWFGMALVDALDYFPVDHPQRKELLNILQRYATAIVKVQDAKTGLWWDILNLPGKEKNYLEASASSMFVYTLSKAARKGYIYSSFLIAAKKGYGGIIKKFIKKENGITQLKGTVKVSGLGGNPYRDGSFDYYVSEPVIVNDPKGMGAFIQAANEIEMLPTQFFGKGKTVLLDRYFNSEKKKDITGKETYWHYTWEEKSNPGFSLLGEIFKRHGADLSSLDKAPTPEDLKKAFVYIIVDPDHEKDNPTPNYIDQDDVKVITKWVNAGGVLLLLANDSANCELKHFNELATVFGIKFTDNSTNMVRNNEYETGSANHELLRLTTGSGKVFLKEVSTLTINKRAHAFITKDENVLGAATAYGKGLVIAVGDPWLYNEYLDGRKLPSEFRNYSAAEDLVKWLLTFQKK
jgi:unsaturated rhamnogalacturonyl hydrolase